ncbi:flagellar basal body rod protein FlgB [Melioribacteraceae bacterium 4301-Me]|uniref:flagellar basal body rod protein FlgB n=1 Tax=Pyranulibacter aquaticus TaxID=3163344 RepID=UPI00359577A4
MITKKGFAVSVSNIKLLEKFLNYCSVKNQVISKNIANAATENYHREDVKFNAFFNDELNSLLKVTEPQHIKSIEGVNHSEFEITEDKPDAYLLNGNNVDIEKEMAELAKNTLNYRFAAKKINNYFKTLQSVIKGGGQQ